DEVLHVLEGEFRVRVAKLLTAACAAFCQLPFSSTSLSRFMIDVMTGQRSTKIDPAGEMATVAAIRRLVHVGIARDPGPVLDSLILGQLRIVGDVAPCRQMPSACKLNSLAGAQCNAVTLSSGRWPNRSRRKSSRASASVA